MKQFFGILGLLAVMSCQNNSTVDTSKFKTILLKSHGEVEVLPDIATFSLELNCLNKSIVTSKQCLVEKSNELHALLQSLGIEKADVLTSSVTMNKSYTWKNNSSVFEGYSSAITLYVTVKNIDKLDEIYTELLENRNLELGGLNYSHSKIDSLQHEAYLNALENSDQLSERLLEKLPESHKEILKIGNVEISASSPQSIQPVLESNYNSMRADVSKSKSIAMGKGTVRVNATLYVEYLIN